MLSVFAAAQCAETLVFARIALHVMSALGSFEGNAFTCPDTSLRRNLPPRSSSFLPGQTAAIGGEGRLVVQGPHTSS